MGRRGPTAISRAPSRAICCMLCGLESVRLELCHWDRCHLQGDGEQMKRTGFAKPSVGSNRRREGGHSQGESHIGGAFSGDLV